MRIVIASTYTPFHNDDSSRLATDLREEMRMRGMQAEMVLLPFDEDWGRIPEQTVALRMLDLSEASGERIDRLITLRSPAHALPHPNKVAWFQHSHREAYDHWGSPWSRMPDDEQGRQHRELIQHADSRYLRECRKVFTNSYYTAERLRRFNAFEANGPLYAPLSRSSSVRPGPFGDYFLVIGRLCPIKRQELAIRAMKHTGPGVRLVLLGAPLSDGYLSELYTLVTAEGVQQRILFTGWVDEGRKAELLAGCCGLLALTCEDEAYSDATLEAFHAAKPVITLSDAGGGLEVVEDGHNGLVVPPEPRALAQAMNRLWKDRPMAQELGQVARQTPERHRINWDHVIESLTT